MPQPRARPNIRPDHNGTQRRQFESNKKKIYMTQKVCGICGKPVDFRLKFPHPLSPCIDHIIPVAKGGHPSGSRNFFCSPIAKTGKIMYNRSEYIKIARKERCSHGFVEAARKAHRQHRGRTGAAQSEKTCISAQACIKAADRQAGFPQKNRHGIAVGNCLRFRDDSAFRSTSFAAGPAADPADADADGGKSLYASVDGGNLFPSGQIHGAVHG